MPKPLYNAVPYDGFAWYLAERRKRRRSRMIWGIVYVLMLVLALYVGFWLIALALAGSAIKWQGKMTERARANGRE